MKGYFINLLVFVCDFLLSAKASDNRSTWV